jgi:hypothetical protein
MARILALFFSAFVFVLPGIGFADDGAKQVVGTWKLLSFVASIAGGDKVEPFGPNPCRIAKSDSEMEKNRLFMSVIATSIDGSKKIQNAGR